MSVDACVSPTVNPSGKRLRSNTHTATLFSMPEKDLACLNTTYGKCSMPTIPGCCTAVHPVALHSMRASILFGLFCKIVFTNCIHTVCSSTYFVRVAAVRYTSKKEKCDLKGSISAFIDSSCLLFRNKTPLIALIDQPK